MKIFYLKQIKLKNVFKRSLILIISENSIGSLLSYLFCVLNNHVALIIDNKTSLENIDKIIINYNPNYIFASKILKKNLKNKFIKIDEIYDQKLYKNKIYKKINLNKNLSLLLSTSGSMGSSKFVKLSSLNLKSNTDSIVSYLMLSKKDIAITNLPSSYSYMLSIINSHFEVGGTISISNNSIIQKEFWNNYFSSKPTSFNGVPYTYEILIKIGLKKIITDKLKYITQAGGKLNDENHLKLVKFCKKNKLKLFIMYGQTEASPRISYLKPMFSNKKIGSIGKAIPGIKMYLTNESKKKIKKPYKKGEIICEGKNVFMGYSNNYKDLKKNNENNFKLKTGDLGYFDEDKFFFLTGRKNKITKIFGNRIDLDQLETLLKSAGYKVICLGKNNKIFVFTEINYNKTKLLSMLSNLTNLNIKSLELIKIKLFPRTTNKKIDYENLREKLMIDYKTLYNTDAFDKSLNRKNKWFLKNQKN